MKDFNPSVFCVCVCYQYEPSVVMLWPWPSHPDHCSLLGHTAPRLGDSAMISETLSVGQIQQKMLTDL